jgi:hypothetical protein
MQESEEREIEVERQRVIDLIDPQTGDYLIYR